MAGEYIRLNDNPCPKCGSHTWIITNTDTRQNFAMAQKAIQSTLVGHIFKE